jgi:dienelactone hydrolase
MDEAFAFVRDAGEALDAKAAGAAQGLPDDVVYAGISWGVGAAQRLAQTQAGARGALLYEACFPVTGEYAFGSWPDDVPVQIHGKAGDEFFAHEGDIDAARELVAIVGPDQAELFVYPGDEHLFVDSSLPSYDPDAAALVTRRTLQFLAAV